MVSLTIDGKNIEVEKGATILEAAARLGITIPTLCWLQKVSPTGACRICAVEIEGVERPITACNTPVKDGIKVTTQSENLSSIRRKIVELLLVNHPIDCPVCDAAGECDLQNACYGLDASRQEYSAVLERSPIRYDWPLIESDPNRCILCEKCVKVDHEVVGADAIEVANCGEATIIDTVDGKKLDCEFCGNCVGVCPTGTLISKPFKFRGRPWAFKVTPSICAFCSSGCQIEYHSRNGRVERVTSDDSNFNSGNLCINGRFGYSYLNSPLRLTTPLVMDGNIQLKSDWNRAMEDAVHQLKRIVETHGSDAVAGIASPRATNEENYLFQKLFRVAIGTNNIDSEAILGYSQAQALLSQTLGFSGASNTIDKIDGSKAVLVIGCDLNAEATGVEYRVIKAATKSDAQLVLANMRPVKLKKFSNSFLQYAPGGDLALITALTKVILDEKLYDADFIQSKGLDLEDLQKSLEGNTLAQLCAAAGISEAELARAGRLVGKKDGISILFGSDLMRSVNAPAAVSALVNLALLCGAVGKDTGGLFPVYEKTNIQGLCDMGCGPDNLPGDATAATFEQVCGKPVPKTPGKNFWEIVEGIEKGTIRALYLLGSDPLTSFPDSGRIRAALQKLELLIVQDIFANSCTALAHIVFPAAAAAEKTGTFTTFDNRIQTLGKAIDPPGEARADWEILAELYNRLAFVSTVPSPYDILEEIRAIAPGYRIASAGTGLCTATVKTSPRLGDKLTFVKPQASVSEQGSGSGLDFTLLAGPILFHSGTMSTFSQNNLEVAPAPYLEFSTEDASRLGISAGSTVKVSSSVASVTGPARIGKVQKGMIFAPHHFYEMNVASLMKGSMNTAKVKVEKV